MVGGIEMVVKESNGTTVPPYEAQDSEHTINFHPQGPTHDQSVKPSSSPVTPSEEKHQLHTPSNPQSAKPTPASVSPQPRESKDNPAPLRKMSTKELLHMKAEWLHRFEGKHKPGNLTFHIKNASAKFPEGTELQSNYIITSHYTVLTFLPLNLYEQFQSLANLYFLFIGILQCINVVSTTDGQPTIYIALLFILSVSGLRAALEDRVRHKADKKRNSHLYEVLRPQGKQKIMSGEIKVGDIVKVNKNEMFPADMLLLGTSLKQGHCFIDKAALNGETRLEIKNSIRETRSMVRSMDKMLRWEASLSYEQPNGKFDSFRGMMALEQEGQMLHLDGKVLLMREEVLRNTDWVYGLTVYTGSQTKIQMSSRKGRDNIKTSKIMHKVNFYLYGMVVFQCSLCLLGGLLAGLYSRNAISSAWYLFPPQVELHEDFSPALVGFYAFFSWFILMSQLVPIALNVAIEMTRFGQTLFLQWDLDLYSETLDKPLQASNSTIHEDLGLVDYIFSDKTGTLTQNNMEFRYALTKGGEEYGSKETEIAKAVIERKRQLQEKLEAQKQGRDYRIPELIPWTELERALAKAKSDPSAAKEAGLSLNEFTPQERNEVLRQLYGRCPAEVPEEVWADRKKYLGIYMRHMALSNTIEPFMQDGRLMYQTESAEELAMVKFAQSLGFVLTKQHPTTLEIFDYDEDLKRKDTPIIEEYRNLATFGFTSQRARVTMIYQGVKDNHIFVMCKGQDTVMLPLCADISKPHKDDLLLKLKDLNTNGLRTLVMAHAELSPQWWEKWAEHYREVREMEETDAVDGHPDKCRSAECVICIKQKLYMKIETEARLGYLGCLGLEDQLQPLVPETIRDCLRAGIKVWMITGDKLEAAKNIALACNLIDADMEPTIHSTDNMDQIIHAYNNTRLMQITGDWYLRTKDPSSSNRLFDIMAETENGHKKEMLLDDLMVFLEAMDCPKTKQIKRLHGQNSQRLKDLHSSNNGYSHSKAETNGESKTLKETLALPFKDKLGVDDSPSAKPDRTRMINREEFIELMRSAKVTQYEAVKYDIEQAIMRYEQIEDKETFPISTLINRTAFMVLFAEKKGYNKTSEGQVVPKEKILRLRQKFFYLASVSKSVIFARAEPAMKKRMVTEIQTRVPKAITLAIGDGANDTDMIKAAHVGVGIAGVEGTAAVNSSDYAISDFNKLHKLLLCHGFWSVDRMCKLVYFMFYKAVLLAMTQYYFGFASMFSGQTFYEDTLYLLYNCVFTSSPIIMLAITDQLLSRSTLQNDPHAYYEQKTHAFRTRDFYSWIVRGFVHSVPCYFLPWVSMEANIFGSIWPSREGQVFGLWYMTTSVYMVICILPSVYVFYLNHSINIANVIVVTVSVIIIFVMFTLMGNVPSDLYGVVNKMFANPHFWLILLLAVMVPMLLELTWMAAQRFLRPTYSQILQERYRLRKDALQQKHRSLRKTLKQQGSQLSDQERKDFEQQLERTDSGVLMASKALVSYEEYINGWRARKPKSKKVKAAVLRVDPHEVIVDTEEDDKSRASKMNVITAMFRFRNVNLFESAARAQYQTHDEFDPNPKTPRNPTDHTSEGKGSLFWLPNLPLPDILKTGDRNLSPPHSSSRPKSATSSRNWGISRPRSPPPSDRSSTEGKKKKSASDPSTGKKKKSASDPSTGEKKKSASVPTTEPGSPPEHSEAAHKAPRSEGGSTMFGMVHARLVAMTSSPPKQKEQASATDCLDEDKEKEEARDEKEKEMENGKEKKKKEKKKEVKGRSKGKEGKGGGVEEGKKKKPTKGASADALPIAHEAQVKAKKKKGKGKEKKEEKEMEKEKEKEKEKEEKEGPRKETGKEKEKKEKEKEKKSRLAKTSIIPLVPIFRGLSKQPARRKQNNISSTTAQVEDGKESKHSDSVSEPSPVLSILTTPPEQTEVTPSLVQAPTVSSLFVDVQADAPDATLVEGEPLVEIPPPVVAAAAAAATAGDVKGSSKNNTPRVSVDSVDFPPTASTSRRRSRSSSSHSQPSSKQPSPAPSPVGSAPLSRKPSLTPVSLREVKRSHSQPFAPTTFIEGGRSSSCKTSFELSLSNINNPAFSPVIAPPSSDSLMDSNASSAALVDSNAPSPGLMDSSASSAALVESNAPSPGLQRPPPPSTASATTSTPRTPSTLAPPSTLAQRSMRQPSPQKKKAAVWTPVKPRPKPSTSPTPSPIRTPRSRAGSEVIGGEPFHARSGTRRRSNSEKVPTPASYVPVATVLPPFPVTSAAGGSLTSIPSEPASPQQGISKSLLEESARSSSPTLLLTPPPMTMVQTPTSGSPLPTIKGFPSEQTEKVERNNSGSKQPRRKMSDGVKRAPVAMASQSSPSSSSPSSSPADTPNDSIDDSVKWHGHQS